LRFVVVYVVCDVVVLGSGSGIGSWDLRFVVIYVVVCDDVVGQ